MEGSALERGNMGRDKWSSLVWLESPFYLYRFLGLSWELSAIRALVSFFFRRAHRGVLALIVISSLAGFPLQRKKQPLWTDRAGPKMV